MKKSKTRTFRVRADLDEKLEAAAKVSGRSVSEEIEHRLNISVDRDRQDRFREFIWRGATPA